MSDAKVTIFTGKKIITMNPAMPVAQAIAVQGDRILGVGTVGDLAQWGDYELNEQFKNYVLMPGFVEAHSHVMAGAVWEFPYVGFYDRSDPLGHTWLGCQTIAAVVDRLAECERELRDPDQTLVAWGLDPIFLEGERLVAKHLDQISATRPIFVFHASGHLATVNSAMMRRSSIDRYTPTPGVARDVDGEPNGELQEPAAMSLAQDGFSAIGVAMMSSNAKWNYAREARNCGVTTIADLGTTRLTMEGQLEAWHEATSHDDYPARVVVAVAHLDLNSNKKNSNSIVSLAVRLRDEEETAKLRFGIVKLVLDGSIQGFTARVSWPHYVNPPPGHPGNGLWLIPPEQLADIVSAYHEAGLTVHCHCNGDEATQVFIDAVDLALQRHPRWDHRHTVQHSQMTTAAQYKKMASLGINANIFSNHIFHWGDQHAAVTIGEERAARMDACATAEREGVVFSVHSDAPITPMSQLHTAWSAVNRLTASGRLLGPEERISVAKALEACTLGAAHQLKLDHDIGSLEAGKLADFAVLEKDPFEISPKELKNIAVWGTVVGGTPHVASST